MRARLLGAWAICVLAAYGCGGGSSTPPPPPDAHDAPRRRRRESTADGPARGRRRRRCERRSRGRRATAAHPTRLATGAATPPTGATARAMPAPDVAAPTCSDHIKNSDETDIDCGGHCGKCSAGKSCLIGADCTFGCLPHRPHLRRMQSWPRTARAPRPNACTARAPRAFAECRSPRRVRCWRSRRWAIARAGSAPPTGRSSRSPTTATSPTTGTRAPTTPAPAARRCTRCCRSTARAAG